MKMFLSAILGLLVVLFLVGFVPKILNQRHLDEMEKHTAGAIKTVHTVTATKAPMEETGFLPGNITARQFAVIYARVDGYLKSRLVDIGDHVNQGQLLAEIDTPTIDEEVAQAQANLAQAQAQLLSAQSTLKEAQAKDETAAAQVEKARADREYTGITATRWENMATKGAVSLQSRDEKTRADLAQIATLKAAVAQKKAAQDAVAAAAGQVKASAAEVVAKKASLSRYQAQQEFKFVRAPFEGVITVRKVDPGALITSGSQSSNLELFQLAKIDDLRIYINVPQTTAGYLRTGIKAAVVVPELPERKFEGEVTNISGGLDQETRTRQTEIHIDNRDHALLPGMYAKIHLSLERSEPWLQIDSNAVVPRDNTTEVVVVSDGTAHYRKIVIGRDFGDTVEVRAGLKLGDVVVVSPPVDLMDGEKVTVAAQSH
jgi:RND family efflux transporter MFP subunit